MKSKVLKRLVSFIIVLVILGTLLTPMSIAANKVNVANGSYTLISALNNSKCLDVSGAGTTNGTNIQLWTKNETVAQKFTIYKVSGDWYSIRNLDSAKAIDVQGGNRKSGVNVQLWEWNGTDAQLWRFFDAGNGYYYIQNKLGYYLDVSGGKTADGTNVWVYSGNSTNAQKWKLAINDGIYTITSKLSSSKRLDVSGAGANNGTNIQLWSANNSVAQSFLIAKYNKTEWFEIINVASKKAVDVQGGKSGSGVNVQLWERNRTNAQLWRFIPVGDGYYYIQNKLGYYLDVSGGKTADGTNVWVYSGNSTNAQKWKIELKDLTAEILVDLCINLHYDFSSVSGNTLLVLMDFYKLFNHNKKYDIKQEARWNSFFDDIIYPGYYSAVLFKNDIMDPEQLGNMIYGYSGNHLGMSNRTIFQGGGYAASGSKYLNNPALYYGDSETDHYFIQKGINLRGNKNIKIDVDLSTVPGWLLDIIKNIL